MAKVMYKDRSMAVKDIGNSLNISRSTLYRYISLAA